MLAHLSPPFLLPQRWWGGEGIPEANLGGVLLNSSNYLTSRHARKIIVDTGYYRRWIGYLWSVFFFCLTVWERVRKEIAKLTFEMVAWKLDDKITPV